MQYSNILNKVSGLIQKNEDRNWIILGDNSSGKSELLRNIVSKMKLNAYYIDSVNRYFNISSTNLSKDGVDCSVSSTEIVNTRVQNGFYNLTDSFGENEHIERLYPIYQERLKSLLKDFLNIDFSIEREKLQEGFGDGEVKVEIDGQEVELSSGYQAIIRMFTELIFYDEHLMGRGLIVIDEIDEFLSPKYSARILNFIIKQFSGHYFIVSTHSSDLVANSNDCNIVTLEKDNFSILDSNDFITLTDVNTLFNKLFRNIQQDKNNLIDSQLQRLLDLKIIDSWTQIEDDELQKINYSKLTSVQKLIYKQIKGW
ncbi:AAA family ATPase [Clostridium estertheticum]|uniref:ATP-binding protein n=1 Tax=Clostridium estertheticum TaxID=238834 RepID=A0AA47EEX2_9CLOT|nr:AAA family ATPase [Clostridium estertheticum]MBU3154996.1 ATP-binding protein [Clostridium estertheticum]WAG58815.1 ATP-binding protein [Clostridium estertheticum]